MNTTAFFRSKLGHASLASVAAMTAMIALTSQMSMAASDAHMAAPQGSATMLVELA